MINNRISLKIENHVAHVMLSRPDTMNALDSEMFAAIPLVGEQIRNDASIRVVVISGDGGNFCSGLDKSNFSSIVENKGLSLDDNQPETRLADRTHGIANTAQYAAWMWRELPMPVIAAVEGFCLGGGLQIALGADFRYASAKSKFSVLEMRWGIVPDMSSTQIMRHMIRDDVIRELTYTARIFGAEEAKEWGFITNIIDDPLAHAMKVANDIALKNPNAIRAAKKIIDASNYQTAPQGLLMESVEQDKIMGSANQIEAVMAELQKRKPDFKD